MSNGITGNGNAVNLIPNSENKNKLNNLVYHLNNTKSNSLKKLYNNKKKNNLVDDKLRNSTYQEVPLLSKT